MTIADIYPLVKTSHIVLVAVSGTLFVVRGLAILAGSTAAMRVPVRYASYLIDTLLLSAALLLLAMLRLNPFSAPWLVAKLGLLLLYIVLGSLALKRARTRVGRALSLGGAIACFAMMLSIAHSHEPLGFLSRITLSQ